jgi:RNA polymerase sigma-70 factor (ECF subfamily)
MVSIYCPLVYRWCRRAGLQQADAADLGQEVFKSVANAIGQFRRENPGQSFRKWLHAITRNKLIDHFRSRKRELPATGGSEALGWLLQVPDALPADDDAADETGLICRRALALIAPEFEDKSWKAFWQVVVDGRSPADIALELGMSANAIYVAKSRILARLRQVLEDFGDM